MGAPYLLCFDFDFLRSLWYKVPEFLVSEVCSWSVGVLRNDKVS